MKGKKPTALHDRIREIIESARAGAARSVNTAQVVSNWMIGREIVEEQQEGEAKAEYGAKLLAELSVRLRKEYGNGYSVDNLEAFRRFYQDYPALISEALPRKFGLLQGGSEKGCAARSRSEGVAALAISQAASAKSWKPGILHPNLSWTHYRMLLKADEAGKRAFYEIEAIKNNWSARELERQISSLLHERLALSRDKKGLMRLAEKGQEVQGPADIFKNPVVMEFLGLPESHKLVESKLEEALIGNLQEFLLEMGKGQLQLYVNYFDRERRSEGDNPTLGLILCADKNDAVVRYTLGPDQRKTIFASRYKLHLPSEAELRAELRREVKELSGPSAS